MDDKNLPDYIKKLSKKMREIWTSIWNSAYRKYKDEKKAFQMANGAIKKLKSEGALFEIQSDLSSVRGISDLTKENFEEYGVNPSIAKYRPNCKIIEGRLFAADLPFCPSTDGITEGYYFIVPKETVEASLWQLTNMPVHVNSELSGHAEKTDEGKKYTSVGTILGAKMTDVDGETWVDVLCGLWENDYPEEVASISSKKDELGMSIEMFFEPETIEAVDFNMLKVGEAAFKGLAILQKARAAFPQTQLLVASKSENKKPIEKQVDKSVYNIEGAENMDINIKSDGTVKGTVLTVDGKDAKNISSMSFSFYQGELKPYFTYSLIEQEKDGWVIGKNYRLSAEGLVEIKADGNTAVVPEPEPQTAKTRGGESVMEYKGIELSKETYTPREIVDMFKSLDAEDSQKKVLAEKDSKIASLEAEIVAFKEKDVAAQKTKDDEAKIEAKKTAVVEAEKWFEANKDSYLPDNKEDVVGIRAKVELGTATKDEILKLAELKKKAGEISADGGDSVEERNKKLDNLFGIKNPVKK
ncbi:MAG: hypothetical protein WC775_06345 [Patescibacteria group bacterium]